jgi:hypothetical protein
MSSFSNEGDERACSVRTGHSLVGEITVGPDRSKALHRIQIVVNPFLATTDQKMAVICVAEPSDLTEVLSASETSVKLPPDYTVTQPTRQPSSQSPL